MTSEAGTCENTCRTAADIEAVVTSFNQGALILEAVQSLCAQTVLPGKIIVVDDGSTDEASIRILKELECGWESPVPVEVLYKENGGVSSARNAGIRSTMAPFVLVLDGDDRLEPAYIARVSALLRGNPSMVAASSWMRTFGVLDAVVCPAGGHLVPFLSRNCCPASYILRRKAFVQCGGYDETMRRGFEDWDFFLSMLETTPDAVIGMVEEPLIDYRTNPVSSNIKSMESRLELMRYIMEKHRDSYRDHVIDAMLGIEAVSMGRLYAWEEEITDSLKRQKTISGASGKFLGSPSYGDGGMASAVRVASCFPEGWTEEKL